MLECLSVVISSQNGKGTEHWCYCAELFHLFILFSFSHFPINHTKRNSSGTSTQWTLPSSSLLRDDGSIPFLDTIITPETDGTFTIGVYRKPTHTDFYLPWDSNHILAAKYSVINTLTHRTHTIITWKWTTTSRTSTWTVQISQMGYQEDFPAT